MSCLCSSQWLVCCSNTLITHHWWVFRAAHILWRYSTLQNLRETTLKLLYVQSCRFTCVRRQKEIFCSFLQDRRSVCAFFSRNVIPAYWWHSVKCCCIWSVHQHNVCWCMQNYYCAAIFFLNCFSIRSHLLLRVKHAKYETCRLTVAFCLCVWLVWLCFVRVFRHIFLHFV